MAPEANRNIIITQNPMPARARHPPIASRGRRLFHASRGRRPSIASRRPLRIAGCCVALAIGILGAGLTEDQFLAAASLATTALYVSYALPIALGALARHRGTWRERGPWSLGKAGAPVAWGAGGWSAAVLATFGLPHAGGYLLLLAGIAGALGILYAVFARGRFTGPRTQAGD